MNKISKKEDIDIEYVILEDKNEHLDEVSQLLHKYLHRYISEEALKEDIEYCFEKGHVLGAYHEDRLIGAVVGTNTPFFDKFHIGHIAVKEKFQGIGIGRKLTDMIIPEGKGATVHLNIGNPGVEKFYEKMGFEHTHRRYKKPAEDASDVKPSD